MVNYGGLITVLLAISQAVVGSVVLPTRQLLLNSAESGLFSLLTKGKLVRPAVTAERLLFAEGV